MAQRETDDTRSNSLDGNGDYVPTDKEVPIPANDAPGSVSGEKTVKGGDEVAPRQHVKKPRHPGVQKVIDVVTNAVSGATSAPKGTPSTPTRNPSERLKAIDAEDKRSMRAVGRYGNSARTKLLPKAIVLALRSAGITGPSKEHVARIVGVLVKESHFAGYRLDSKGQLAHRKLPIDKLAAYGLGSTALKADEWGADQWLKHRTLFDVAALGIAIAETAMDLTDKEGAFAKAVMDAHRATQDPVPAENVKVSDPT